MGSGCEQRMGQSPGKRCDGALMRTEKSIRVVEIVAKESQVEVGNTVRWYPGPDSVTVELCVGQGRAPEPGPWG